MHQDGGRGSDGASVGVALEAHDGLRLTTNWLIEKWSEDAVDWARDKLRSMQRSHVQDGVKIVHGLIVPNFKRIEEAITSPIFREFGVQPDLGIEFVPGNLFLNEGIQELWDLAIAAGGTTAYNNANAEIGVGDSTTAEAATQTDLQAATNKLFKAMVATYPQRTNQTVDFRSDFTSAEANYAWQEWSVRNGNTRNKNLNRKVQSLGTKATGTWTITASLTIA